ncbi:mixed lineage kinase domain-like protein [Tachysurus fulvidraco]|uniref:mixed lineage kinase domain-like protein n=1 Tax=Tachysurus fulvidraco TaxID=1234273 RepID=UPI000F4D332E|nr:mixed lineage kinase domain-like protein [Tachysurus fulvidraco]XP_026990919.1 mixed lineage kinase domain-like protein [Tachysurus fulvidraco]
MDIIDPILSIAEKLYDLCSEVKANKKRCKRLADRVSSLVELVKVVRNKGFGKNPDIVQRGLRELKFTLESAEEVVKKYTSSSCLKRIVRVSDLGEEFGSLNERLNDAAQLLLLALQVEQRDKMDRVFKEDKRRKEDEEDRRHDYAELLNLLQSLADEKEKTKVSVDAVHVKVEQTQKDVQDIKGILESLRRPSLQLQDIREIRPEELTYDIPIKPIMKTDSSELFKGEYNKFTVAIKKYAYPVSTSPNQLRSIFNKEVETMKRFESPHILRMFGICVQNEKGPNPTYLIVMEFCEKGNLRHVLDGPSKLPWERKIHMCLDAAQGLYRLHQSEEKFKVHGCLTSSKFLVGAGYRIKLGGFELAMTETSLKHSKKKKNSSMAYISPQELEDIHHLYDKPCEIYSFGIVLWEIATREIPFKDCTSYPIIYKKVFVEKTMEPLPTDCPSQLRELINACRSFDAFQRPSAGVLVDKLQKLAQQNEED